MRKQLYKDCCGTYSITVFFNGKANLKCCDCYGKKWHDKDYKTRRGAEIALARFCGGMPRKIW